MNNPPVSVNVNFAGHPAMVRTEMMQFLGAHSAQLAELAAPLVAQADPDLSAIADGINALRVSQAAIDERLARIDAEIASLKDQPQKQRAARQPRGSKDGAAEPSSPPETTAPTGDDLDASGAADADPASAPEGEAIKAAVGRVTHESAAVAPDGSWQNAIRPETGEVRPPAPPSAPAPIVTLNEGEPAPASPIIEDKSRKVTDSEAAYLDTIIKGLGMDAGDQIKWMRETVNGGFLTKGWTLQQMEDLITIHVPEFQAKANAAAEATHVA